MDGNNTEIVRLEKNIEVLQKSYDNIIIVMNEDVGTKEDEDGKIELELKDDKIKTYAEGIEKCARTLNYLYKEISDKTKELEALKNPNGVTKPIADGEVSEETQEPTKKKGNNLSNHLH